MEKWTRRSGRIAGFFALGLLVALTPKGAQAQAICGNGVVDDGDQVCAGDCDGNGSVTVDEIVTMVNAALNGGNGGCPNGDINMDGSITVDEIVTAVNNALNGCPGAGAGTAADEQCDNGGLCVGGADAGDACTQESDCDGDGACFGGLDDLRGCTGNEDCRDGTCRKCRPYGGDGCSANCTDEADSAFTFVTGQLAPGGGGVVEGTSGATVNGAILVVPLPLTGGQILTNGKIVNGSAPTVVKANNIDLERIQISTIACACVRATEARTCGGTTFDADGNESANCTPGFVGAEVCPAQKKCSAIHGPGNTASGFITCGAPGVDIDYSLDCNGTAGAEPFDPVVTVFPAAGSGSESAGSAYLTITVAIGTVVGMCSGNAPDYGADHEFCTDDDPLSNRGMPNSIPFTTNAATVTVFNPGDFEGDMLGPFTTTGAPFTCNQDNSLGLSATNLAGAFGSCDQPTVSDIGVPVNFVAQ